MKKYLARVSKKRMTKDRFVYLKLSLLKPTSINFEAWQYISFSLKGGEKRSYSIASSPAENHFVELIVDLKPGGIGSEFISNLSVGQEISFVGPEGETTLENSQKDQQLLFVASGTGISPIRSMLKELMVNRRDRRPVTLIWGLQLQEDFGWDNDFKKMAQEKQNFKLTIGTEQEIAGFINQLGRFDETWGAYVCGKPEMVTDTKKLLVDRGMSQDKIYYDRD